MFHRLSIVLFAALMAPHGSLRGDENSEMREFTDKRGQKIEARLLRVSEDRKLMHIVRGDGVEFDTEINLLSLDDQQYIKDWMMKETGKAAPLVPMAVPAGGYRLDVSIARTNGGSTDRGDGVYKFETKETLYRITIRNLSRLDLEGARVEFAIVWRDEAIIHQRKESQEWDYTTGVYEDSTSRVKLAGSLPLEALRYNAGVTVETVAVPVDRVLYDGREEVYADDVLGIKVRVVSAAGELLHESELGSSDISALNWDQIAALPDPRRYD